MGGKGKIRRLGGEETTDGRRGTHEVEVFKR